MTDSDKRLKQIIDHLSNEALLQPILKQIAHQVDKDIVAFTIAANEKIDAKLYTLKIISEMFKDYKIYIVYNHQKKPENDYFCKKLIESTFQFPERWGLKNINCSPEIFCIVFNPTVHFTSTTEDALVPKEYIDSLK